MSQLDSFEQKELEAMRVFYQTMCDLIYALPHEDETASVGKFARQYTQQAMADMDALKDKERGS